MTGMLSIIGFVVILVFTTQADAGSIQWKNKQLGNSCKVDGMVTKCEVTKGSQAEVKGSLEIQGDVQSLTLTLTWTNLPNAVTKAPVCLNGGQLQIGCAAVAKIPAATYVLQSKQITVPQAVTNAKVLTMKVDVTFSDGTSNNDYLIGNLEVLLK